MDTVGEELLLYDRDRHIAHCLSPIAAGVWRHCDGERDVTELAILAGASVSLVADALRELREKDLLDAEPQPMQSTTAGESRREAIVRAARYGAAAAGASLIASATAATPAMASSGELKKCEVKSDETKSCCLCNNGACIDNLGVIGSKKCAEECEKMGSTLNTFAKEGKCV
ncbi:MAG TPA: hypothetical protein VMG80_01175 [Solirubrobacteraceae bacterium]|nr:hypothetical protein [Solirubrobacteraceae bacterium]